MNAIVKIDGIFAEDLFEWFYTSVMADGGDGGAIICCSNDVETAENFIQWWNENKLKPMQDRGSKLNSFFHPLDIQDNGILNFHDQNESFMFADREVFLLHNEKSFIVNGECKSAFKPFSIKPLT